MAIGISDNTQVTGGLGINADHEAKVALTLTPEKSGIVRSFCENDNGAKTGTPSVQSPESDADYRLRTAADAVLDNEIFNYTAQNTGKHTYALATMTVTWTTAGLTTNGANVVTTGYGCTFGTYAEFPVFGSGSLYCEMEGGFSAQPVANATIDFGMFRRGASAAYAPADGAYFRLNSAGLQGVVNYNGTEALTPVFDFAYTNAKKYQFIITINQREVRFWIDGQLYASLQTQAAQGQPFMSASLPFSLRQAHVGTAGGVINLNLNSYSITSGGPQFVTTLGEQGNRVYGSYQGLSGGTMGSLVSGTVGTGTLAKPTAVVPANNSLVAGLCNSLGGRSWETFTTGLALNTDGILQAYLVPAGTVSIQGRRLRIRGVKLTASVQTVMVGGPFVNEFQLAFGFTGGTPSLQTAEAAATKTPRRIFLPELTQVVTAAQAVSTIIAQPVSGVAYFEEPIFVNPGEWVALVVNRMGTAGTSGVIAYNIQYDYSWE